ncbi:MAG TPA: hypothetical protein VF516_14615, partial [Kofleriaceae bacterium]
MPRPSRIAATMVAKLSSASTMSDTSRVTSVPVLPIAIPTWASRSAGASLTPSPVIATIAPRAFQSRTLRSLSSGVARAWTRPSGGSPGRAMPSSRAITCA